MTDLIAPSCSADRADLARTIDHYTRTWTTLRRYDEGGWPPPPGAPPQTPVTVDDVLAAAAALRSALVDRGEASEVLGRPRTAGAPEVAGLLGALDQTMFAEPLYPSAAERAAHLLYFMVKDHPFVDGNKRIGALVFVRYLIAQGAISLPSPDALALLTLLVAESRPDAKATMINVIVALLDACGGPVWGAP